MADTVAMATEDGAADAPGAAPSSVGAIPATPAPTTAQPIRARSADPATTTVPAPIAATDAAARVKRARPWRATRRSAASRPRGRGGEEGGKAGVAHPGPAPSPAGRAGGPPP